MFPFWTDDNGFLDLSHRFPRPSSCGFFGFDWFPTLPVDPLFLGLVLTLTLTLTFGIRLLLESVSPLPKSTTAIFGPTVASLLTDARKPAFNERCQLLFTISLI